MAQRTLKELINSRYTGSVELYLPLGVPVLLGSARLKEGRIVDARVVLGGRMLTGAGGIREVEQRACLLLCTESVEETDGADSAEDMEDARMGKPPLDALRADLLKDYS